MKPETLYADGPDGDVAYQVLGEGPDALFVPPWAWNIDVMWEEPRIERFIRRMASFRRLIVFDKRGLGMSDLVPRGALPTIEAWTDDISVVLDEVGSDGAAVITASESSFMGILYAASHPERATNLVIVSGASCVARKDDYPYGLPAHRVDKAVAWFASFDPAPLIAPSDAADERFRTWSQRFARSTSPPSARDGGGPRARRFSEELTRSTQVWDVRAVLPTISVPTLVLHRADDHYYLVGHGRYMAEHIPNASYVELPGDDHVFYAGNQDQILDEIQGFLTGSRGSPDLDRVLATVLFTDLVASTDRAAVLGDRAWRRTLDEHDTLVAEAVERFRGRRIKTTGDGVLATFDGPARAIRCAGEIGEDVRRRLGIEVRAGLHTGEVELRGDDIGGIAVALAARVMAAAAPNEVLVSGTVKDLVVGSGIEFEDRGSRALKGVPGEWRLFAVRD